MTRVRYNLGEKTKRKIRENNEHLVPRPLTSNNNDQICHVFPFYYSCSETNRTRKTCKICQTSLQFSMTCPFSENVRKISTNFIKCRRAGPRRCPPSSSAPLYETPRPCGRWSGSATRTGATGKVTLARPRRGSGSPRRWSPPQENPCARPWSS